MEKWEVTRIIKIIMEKKYLDKLRNLPHALNQFVGLISVTVVVILFFVTLNIFFGQGDELVKKMKIEEERIAKERKLSELTSSLPSGILVTFDGTNHFKLTDELYEAVCNATKLIPQRAIMGANFLNFKAHEIYTKNGNLIDETFVKWDKDKNKCITGYTVSGNNIGIDETITVTGEALSFLSTGIDTRVYFIKNF
ncbi:unknown membrane protein [Candidatus Pelagibacter ubique HTCC1002]|nr:unknown membrane protein [Candidatus Pelagibacter ubique HTCC1002]